MTGRIAFRAPPRRLRCERFKRRPGRRPRTQSA
ncbi:hypothetical protein DM47_3702 [Burkholderia mallei]|nr:hypothetical protein BPC006_I2905 [Burkholderia pseudomallei BPC006]KOT15899.1 hypothetical protein DM47_3702 [Burkholderia mallei]